MVHTLPNTNRRFGVLVLNPDNRTRLNPIADTRLITTIHKTLLYPKELLSKIRMKIQKLYKNDISLSETRRSVIGPSAARLKPLKTNPTREKYEYTILLLVFTVGMFTNFSYV